jgi:hypothetical protein
MNYIKVEPWGSSKTITYDDTKELKPALRYQSSMSVMTNRNNDYTEPPRSSSLPYEMPAGDNGTGNNNATKDSSIIENALAEVRSKIQGQDSTDWDGLFNDLLNIKEIDAKARSTAFTAAAHAFAKNGGMKTWRDAFTEEDRVSIADAIVAYHKSSAPVVDGTAGQGQGSSPEPLTGPVNGNASGLGMTREAMEEKIFNEFYNAFLKNGFLLPEQKEKFKEGLYRDMGNASDQQLRDQILAINKACRDGEHVLMLNAKGNLVEGC